MDDLLRGFLTESAEHLTLSVRNSSASNASLRDRSGARSSSRTFPMALHSPIEAPLAAFTAATGRRRADADAR